MGGCPSPVNPPVFVFRENLGLARPGNSPIWDRVRAKSEKAPYPCFDSTKNEKMRFARVANEKDCGFHYAAPIASQKGPLLGAIHAYRGASSRSVFSTGIPTACHCFLSVRRHLLLLTSAVAAHVQGHARIFGSPDLAFTIWLSLFRSLLFPSLSEPAF